MKYFDTYTSNTIAASANQHTFTMEKGEVRTGRVFYKILSGGTYNYSLLFSNIIDSTYADGSVSHKNLVVDEWEILEAKLAVFDKDAVSENFMEDDAATEINNQSVNFTQLTFDGKITKTVLPGEFFSSDPISLTIQEDEYLCLEITFKGNTIPYHEESFLPVFTKTDKGWIYDRRMPFAGMVGCDRPAKLRVGFIGDSITQGIGVPHNSYKHWNAELTKKLSPEYAYWNLGIGYARATDMATDGAWAFKAKNNDVVVVCLGVNDTFHGNTEAQLTQALDDIVNFLKKRGIKIILQTIPPFGYEGEKIDMWKNVNHYIKTELSTKVDMVFDVVPYLQMNSENSHIAKFEGHPNAEGCKIWAEELLKTINSSHIFD